MRLSNEHTINILSLHASQTKLTKPNLKCVLHRKKKKKKLVITYDKS